jgi:hypothetical protein
MGDSVPDDLMPEATPAGRARPTPGIPVDPASTDHALLDPDYHRTHALTGQVMKPVRFLDADGKVIRHWTLEGRAPGALTLCGQTVSALATGDVWRTCEACAEKYAEEGA